MKSTPKQPFNGNGLGQLIRDRNSMRHKWVKGKHVFSSVISNHTLFVIEQYCYQPVGHVVTEGLKILTNSRIQSIIFDGR